jgi:hypothetical protein
MILELLEKKYWIAREDNNYDEMRDILRRIHNIEEIKKTSERAIARKVNAK